MRCLCSVSVNDVSVVNYGTSLAGGGDSVTGHCYPPSSKRFVKSGGQFSAFFIHRIENVQQTVFRSRSECDKQLRILQRQKREYIPTLINTALRQTIAMLQHQVGAQHSQYFLVIVRRLPFDKDLYRCKQRSFHSLGHSYTPLRRQ